MFSTAHALWDINIDYFDLDVCRCFSFCNCFDIYPYLGIRGLWIDQHIDINAISPTVSFSSNLKGKIAGYGVKGGLDGDLKLGCGFFLLGHVGGSILYSKFTNEQSAFFINGPLGSIHGTDRTYRSILSVESFIGLQYVNCICCFPISFYVGWENHIIFETSQFSSTGGGNLTMQGLTLGGSIGF